MGILGTQIDYIDDLITDMKEKRDLLDPSDDPSRLVPIELIPACSSGLRSTRFKHGPPASNTHVTSTLLGFKTASCTC